MVQRRAVKNMKNKNVVNVRRAAGFVSHACSDCVYTRDDTVRLDYASEFVRVIYSSHTVSIKLGTVTHLRRCGLAVHER